jgi:hypothetical protein
MSDNGDDFARAVRHNYLSGFHQSTAGVSYVVNEDGNSVLHVANEDHVGDFVRTGELLVDEGKAEVEAVGNKGCSLRTPSVRTNDNALLNLQIRLNPPQRTRLRIQIVDWHIEEALYLTSMHIHCDDMIAPSRLQHIGNKLRRDRGPRLILLVLPRIWEIRGDSYDSLSACGFCTRRS